MDTLNLFKHIKLNSAGKTYCAPDWHWDTQDYIKDFDIWVPLSGRGFITIGNTTLSISPGDCFLLRPNERYIFIQNPQYPFSVIYIHFDIIDDNGNILKHLTGNIPAFHRRIDSLTFFSSLLERVVTANMKGNKDRFEAEHWLKSVLMEMFTNDQASQYTGIEQVQSGLINEICEKIKRDPLNYGNIFKIAEMYSYSSDHFCRLFKKYRGITPSNFINSIKIEQAKVLLRSSSYSIGRISELLGYSDIYHFSNKFKRKTGLSPSKYRKS